MKESGLFSHNHCEDTVIRVGHCEYFFHLMPDSVFQKTKETFTNTTGTDIIAM